MPELDDSALKILNGRHIGTLGTHNPDGTIHLAAVWYLYKDGNLYMTMNSKTRKFRNIKSRPTASLMIDTREAGRETGITASGEATAITGDEAQKLSRQILERYFTDKALSDPEIANFFASYEDAIVCLSPRSWTSWDVGQIYTQLFGGKLSTETGYVFPLD